MRVVYIVVYFFRCIGFFLYISLDTSLVLYICPLGYSIEISCIHNIVSELRFSLLCYFLARANRAEISSCALPFAPPAAAASSNLTCRLLLFRLLLPAAVVSWLPRCLQVAPPPRLLAVSSLRWCCLLAAACLLAVPPLLIWSLSSPVGARGGGRIER